MAKVSPVSIKYMVKASFKAEGPLEKPDVIGAIFGQTEGLLGDELEMRELQKEGKIGRIEVNLDIVDGKSVGEIFLPSALDKSETTIIAAALETIDRIGPTEAEIKVLKIEDVRGSKRDFIIARAKALLDGLDNGGEFEEISKTVKEESRAAKIQEYGEERLPAGDISGEEIIVVEGRADVVNLLKNRVNNVIGMNGTKLPVEIAKLGESKQITLFVDGDRGGRLIANNVIKHARVAFVANAPDGKEVEELTGKEILMSLRKKISVGEYLRNNRADYNDFEADVPEMEDGEVREKIKSLYEEDVKESKSAILLDKSLDVIMKVQSKDAGRAVSGSRNKVFAVVMDGSVSASMAKICSDLGVKYLAATNFGSVGETKTQLISL